MSRFLAYFLTALLLLQTLGPEVLVLNYQLNKAAITARYCVNKARPAALQRQVPPGPTAAQSRQRRQESTRPKLGQGEV